MKGRLNKSMGIVTLITEVLAKIKPTEPLIFDKSSSSHETKQIPQVILQLKY